MANSPTNPLDQHATKRGRRSPTFPALNLQLIANSAGISSSHLSRLLRGVGRPSLTTAAKIAEAMGITLDTLTNQLDYLRRKQDLKLQEQRQRDEQFWKEAERKKREQRLKNDFH